MGTRAQLSNLTYEQTAGLFTGTTVVGTDEVGRGCIAGPVVAATVQLPSSPDAYDTKRYPWLTQVTDSKKLTPQNRARLAPAITAWATASTIRYATVDEIERYNILRATFLAMKRCMRALPTPPQIVLLDGGYVPKTEPGGPFGCKTIPIVKGDSKSLSIACASILAKVWRDDLMTALSRLYPGYGFEIHKGYATATHRQAIQTLGPSSEHRLSFLSRELDLFSYARENNLL